MATNNAGEQKQISGVWKVVDTPTFPEQDIMETVNVSLNINHLGTLYTSHCDIVIITASGIIRGNVARNEPDMGDDYLGDGVGYANGAWETSSWGDGLKIWDFGTQPQYVSAEFYNWMTANAIQPTVSVWYNGTAIANLLPGQKATLACAGLKMADDVVIIASM